MATENRPVENGDQRRRLENLFRTAINAATPGRCLQDHWPAPPRGRMAILSIGKAAAAMAQAACRHYGDTQQGLALVPDGHLRDIQLPAGIRLLQSSHPVPDRRSIQAADAALNLAAGLTKDDLLLVLLSGGGSAVMSKPCDGVTLKQKQDLSRQLHASGASIAEINCVRKQLSAVKGGRLLQATHAQVITLAISDVPGDDPSLIASGPTVSDQSTPAEALKILEKYRIKPEKAVTMVLNNRSAEISAEKDQQPASNYVIVASGNTMLRAAGKALEQEGFTVINLGDRIEGNARDLAVQHAELAKELLRRGGRHCILSGGESTVTIDGIAGSGGRNTEYLLALAIALGQAQGITALAADSDGIDGNGAHAGACIYPHTLERAAENGLDPEKYMRTHDSAAFFQKLGDLMVTGPTQTNVNDLRVILVGT